MHLVSKVQPVWRHAPQGTASQSGLKCTQNYTKHVQDCRFYATMHSSELQGSSQCLPTMLGVSKSRAAPSLPPNHRLCCGPCLVEVESSGTGTKGISWQQTKPKSPESFTYAVLHMNAHDIAYMCNLHLHVRVLGTPHSAQSKVHTPSHLCTFGHFRQSFLFVGDMWCFKKRHTLKVLNMTNREGPVQCIWVFPHPQGILLGVSTPKSQVLRASIK